MEGFTDEILNLDTKTIKQILAAAPQLCSAGDYWLFRRSAIRGRADIVNLISNVPLKTVYELFDNVAGGGRVSIVKNLLARADNWMSMIASDRFCAMRMAIINKNIGVVSFLISLCDASLLSKMMHNCKEAFQFAGKNHYGHVVSLLVLTPFSYSMLDYARAHGYRLKIEPNPEYDAQLSAAYTFTASPELISQTLGAGRDLVGWILAARRAETTLGLPAEIVCAIFDYIDPRWQKIFGAMRSSVDVPIWSRDNLFGENDHALSRAKSLLCRARFLRAAI